MGVKCRLHFTHWFQLFSWQLNDFKYLSTPMPINHFSVCSSGIVYLFAIKLMSSRPLFQLSTSSPECPGHSFVSQSTWHNIIYPFRHHETLDKWNCI